MNELKIMSLLYAGFVFFATMAIVAHPIDWVLRSIGIYSNGLLLIGVLTTCTFTAITTYKIIKD